MIRFGKDRPGKDNHTRFPFLVAIETDPERTPAESGGRPRILNQGDAEQMLAHLTADLGSVLGGIGNCRITACGSLFDQCQVLRPGLPVFEALSGLLKNDQSHTITPGQTALGSLPDSTPDPALTPDKSIPPAVLLLLPMLIAGPEQVIRDLGDEMEHRFLGEGQVSAHTASWLEAAFGIGISHARFMTVTDLNAMFRLQLEHFGYLPLWELTDAAVNGLDQALSLTATSGTEYRWLNGEVRVNFQTFDYWASQGAGHAIANDELGHAYAESCRELRRYTSTLAAHHVPVRFDLPPECTGEVGDDYLCEETRLTDAHESLASITEHSWNDLGIVAITVQTPEILKHFYPLTPGGLNTIHEIIQGLELSGEGMSFPGRVRFCETNRRLRPAGFAP